MKEFANKQFLKALFIGGPLIVAGLVSLVVFVGLALNDAPLWKLFLCFIFGVSFLYTALWVTGFWGKWGMILFFTLAPLVVLMDFAVNPVAPLGSIVFGIVCLYIFVDKNVLSKNS